MFTTARAFGLAAAFLIFGDGMVAAQTGGAPDIEPAEPGTVQELELVDGSRMYGRVVEVEGDMVRFELLSGDTLEVRRERVRRITEARGQVQEGEFYPRDPNETRLFFAPTGRTVPASDGYLSMYYIVMPFLGLGVTDHLMLAGGVPLLFGDGMPTVFWLAPKLRVASAPGFNASIGSFSFFGLDEDSFGLLFGVATFGQTSDAALTLGLGFGYSGSDVAGEPAAMIGGELRTSRSVKLITENYVVPGGEVLLSAGPRFMGRRLSADLALVWPAGEGIVFPLINFVYSW